MFEFLSAGILLGLAAGFTPGPLLVLVISETLRHTIKAGIKVSIAPLITDVPIILISLLVLNRLANFKVILGCISIFGGLFILYLGYESLKTKGVESTTIRAAGGLDFTAKGGKRQGREVPQSLRVKTVDSRAKQPVWKTQLNLASHSSNSFRKGVITNALNPHPYIFYMTVGAPIIFKSINQNIFSTVLFVGSFLLFLVGSKVVLAMVVERSRSFLQGSVYIWVMRILGILLLFFSIVLFGDGFRLLALT
jgi:threonine/homoserine/homoserine lactone efflux protein